MIRKDIYRWLFLVGVLFACISCIDDDIVSTIETGDGEALVQAEVSFKPFAQGLTDESRTAGDAIKDIKNLCVLVYNVTEAGTELRKSYYLTPGSQPSDTYYKITEEQRADADADNGKKAENQTDHAEFKLKLPYGTYKIYAVANMGNLADNETFKSQINTAEDLKSISLSWNANNIESNNQMFGHFTVKGAASTNDEIVVVNKATPALHAWIKRAASKVTVAYDATNLNDNVYIYLKSVQIKDIPKTCYLGNVNTPSAGSNNQKPEDVLYLDAPGDNDIIYYYGTSSSSYTNWPRLSKGNKYYYYMSEAGYPASLDNAHSETMNALFFFENMQGNGDSMPDKRQDYEGAKDVDGNVVGDGILEHPGLPNDNTYRKKDDVLYGTYVEVKAYYVNNNPGANTDGEIVYRFMLGKDILKNYDAERNYHYKLTLCFNGDANDVDWHIEYEEDAGVYLPDPGFISYSYNEIVELPIRVVPAVGQQVGSIVVKIEENPWWPDDAVGTGLYDESDMDKRAHNGFLSLGLLNTSIVDPKTPEYTSADVGTNEAVWKAYQLGERVFNVTSDGTYEWKPTFTQPDDLPDVENNLGGSSSWKITNDVNSNDVLFEIPFYTLPKTMTTWTGYTGTNIYFNKERVARVSVTAYTGENGTGSRIGQTREIEFKQVKRLENPNGIWRAHNNNSSFTVKLYEHNTSQTEGGYSQSFNSVGSWRVYVESATNENGQLDASWIKINGTSKHGFGTGNVLATGVTDTPVEFVYEPGGKINSNQVRCGVIVVEYNNNSCRHRIFVRQGYAPLAIVAEGTEWYSFNLINNSKLAASPLDEGSMFKFGNLTQAIRENNNWVSGLKSMQEPLSTYQYAVENRNGDLSYPTWRYYSDDYEYISSNTTGFTTETYLPAGSRVSSTQDWLELHNNADVYYDFGVLYDDNVSVTKVTDKEATQYSRSNENGTTGVDGQKRGMRGCFVYNKKTGKQLFFPIGNQGYGRRKNSYNGDTYGTLKYANMNTDMYIHHTNDKVDPDTPYSGVQLRPLLWDLYRTYGAIYWCRTPDTTIEGKQGINYNSAWDINYRTFDFNMFYSYANNYHSNSHPTAPSGIQKNESDACFIRLVRE